MLIELKRETTRTSTATGKGAAIPPLTKKSLADKVEGAKQELEEGEIDEAQSIAWQRRLC